jgi:phosphate transport system substrate-binding protein
MSMVKACAVWLLMIVCMAAGLPGNAAAETLTIGGTGSSGPLAQLLFEEFRKEAPDVSLRLISPPLGTNGALKALAAGRIDLALAGRSLRNGELGSFGQHFELAATPFVLASSGGQRKGGFSLDELARVYEGSLTHWDTGAPIRLVLRPAFDADTMQLRAMGPGMDKAVARSFQRPGMAVALNDLDAAELLANTPGSLGPTTMGLLKTLGMRLALMPLNGVQPSLETLKAGGYPWRKTITVVLPVKPSLAAGRFAAFLRSHKAREILLQNYYLPSAP